MLNQIQTTSGYPELNPVISTKFFTNNLEQTQESQDILNFLKNNILD